MHKSKLGLRASLFLTVISTLAFGMANGQWAYKSAGGVKSIDLDFGEPHVYQLAVGEEIQQLNPQLTDDLYKAMQIILTKVDETTVSKVVVGQAPAGVTAASALNLLSQGAGLPLYPIQNAVGEALAILALMIPDYIRGVREELHGRTA